MADGAAGAQGAHELYALLAKAEGAEELDVTDMQSTGTYQEAQRKFIQQKKENAVVARVNARTDLAYEPGKGKVHPVGPKHSPLAGGTAGDTNPTAHATAATATAHGTADGAMAAAATDIATAGMPAPGEPDTIPAAANKGSLLKRSSTALASTPLDEANSTFELDTTGMSRPRVWAMHLCAHPDFEFLVVIIIFANLVVLALNRPTEPEDSPWNGTMFWIEAGLNFAFTGEMILRMVALGGVLKYLKHPWNSFDCTMVLVGYTAFIPSDSNTNGLRALRAMRALRPLRSITRFEALRSIVVCFFEAVPMLASVVGLLLFFIFVYAVAGTMLFMNVFHQKCFDADGKPEEAGDDEDMYGCGNWRTCPTGYTCEIVDGLVPINIAGFDNVAISMLTVFQSITLNGWSFAMYRTTDNISPVAIVYYVSLTVMGAYVLMNLFLAVLKIKFAKAQTAFHARRATQRNRTRKNTVMSLFTAARSKWKSVASQRSAASSLNHSVATIINQRMSMVSVHEGPRHGNQSMASQRSAGDAGKPASMEHTSIQPFSSHGVGPAAGEGMQATAAAKAAALGEATEHRHGGRSLAAAGASMLHGPDAAAGADTRTVTGGLPVAPDGSSIAQMVLMMDPQEFDEFTEDQPFWPRTWLRVQFRSRVLAQSERFAFIMLAVIMVNTVVLAMDHDGMSKGLEEALDNANYAFTAIFTLEMATKLVGLGFWDYIADSFNLFDGTIVALSWVELIIVVSGANVSVGALSALRAFRVLRLIKMFRYIKSLRRIGTVLISSMTSFAAIVVLIVLFWVVFAVVGQHVFGGLILTYYPFPNYNTFFNALVATFNILNLENFQNNMFAVVRSTNYGSTLFFLAWIVLGKYILLSLFLAVTLEAFESKYDTTASGGSSWMSRIHSAATGLGSTMRSTHRGPSQGGSALRSLGPNRRPISPPLHPPSPRKPASQLLLGAAEQEPMGAASTAAAADGGGGGGAYEGGLAAGKKYEDAQMAQSRLHDRLSLDMPGPVDAGADASHRPRDSASSSIDYYVAIEPHARRTAAAAGAGAGAASAGAAGRGPQPVAEGIEEEEEEELKSAAAAIAPATGVDLNSNSKKDTAAVAAGWPLVLATAEGAHAHASPCAMPAMCVNQPAVMRPKASPQHSPRAPRTPSHVLGVAGLARGPAGDSAAGALGATSGHLGSEADADWSEDAASISALMDLLQLGKGAERLLTVLPSGSCARTVGPTHGSVVPSGAKVGLLSPEPPSQRTASQASGRPSHSHLRAQSRAQAVAMRLESLTPDALSATSNALPPGQQQQQQLSAYSASSLILMHASTGGIRPISRTGPSPTFSSVRPESGNGRLGAQSTTLAGSIGHASASAWGSSSGPVHGTAPGMTVVYSNPAFEQRRLGRDEDEKCYDAIVEGCMRLHGAPASRPAAARAAGGISVRARGQVEEHSSLDRAAGGNGTGNGSDSDELEALIALAALPDPRIPAPTVRSTLTAEASNALATSFTVRNAATRLDSQASLAGVPRVRCDSAGGDNMGRLPSRSALSMSMSQAPWPAAASPPGSEHTPAGAGSACPGTSTELPAASASAAVGSPPGQQGKTGAAAVAAVPMPPASMPSPAPRRKVCIAANNDEHEQGPLLTHAQSGVPGASRPNTSGNMHAGMASRTMGGTAQGQFAPASRTVSGAPMSRAVSLAGSTLQPADSCAALLADSDYDGLSGSGRLMTGLSEATSCKEAELSLSGPVEGGCQEEVGGSGKKAKKRKHHKEDMIPLSGKSFFVFGVDNWLRRKTYRLLNTLTFELSLLTIILFNMLIMALDSPNMDDASTLGRILYYSNLACTLIFAFEALAKVFAWTFSAYIRKIVNAVDFLVVVSALLELALTLTGVGSGALAVLRVLRVLRALRLLTRSAGMRLVFHSVVMSLGAMANVSVCVVLVFLIFAILGVQVFNGRFYSCNDTSVAGVTECVGNFTTISNTTATRVWKNRWPNFDNTGQALLTCFVVAGLNGYTPIMQAALAAPAEKGQQPKPMTNPGAFFWFAAFAFVCAYMLLNLYVGVIFSQFSRIRNLSETGSAFLTHEQNEWVELSRMVFKLTPPDKASLPTGKRLFWYRLVHSKGLDLFMMAVIIVNVGFMTLIWYGQPRMVGIVEQYANYVFTAIFTLEAAVKIYALGWTVYWKDSWNKFDFMLVVLAIIDVALTFLHATFLRVLRIFRLQRLLRTVRILRKSKGIQMLFQTLIVSLPAFANVGSLIALLFFMFSYVGVMAFGAMPTDDTERAINEHANFANFLMALQTLYRIATGDNWSDVMQALVMGPDGTWIAIPYVLAFYVVIPIIMLNLFTAVIIENFEKQQEQDAWRLTPQNLEEFVTLWAEYDDGSGTMDPKHLEGLLLRLEPPLGLGPYTENKDVLRFVYDLDIPLVDGRVPFRKTAFELVKRISKADMPEGALKEQLDRLVERAFKDIGMDDTLNVSVALGVLLIQRKWRTRMRAARMRRLKEWRAERMPAAGLPNLTTLIAWRDALWSAYKAEMLVHKAGQAPRRYLPKHVPVANTCRFELTSKYAPWLAPVILKEEQEEAARTAPGLAGLGRRLKNLWSMPASRAIGGISINASDASVGAGCITGGPRGANAIGGGDGGGGNRSRPYSATLQGPAVGSSSVTKRVAKVPSAKSVLLRGTSAPLPSAAAVTSTIQLQQQQQQQAQAKLHAVQPAGIVGLRVVPPPPRAYNLEPVGMYRPHSGVRDARASSQCGVRAAPLQQPPKAAAQHDVGASMSMVPAGHVLCAADSAAAAQHAAACSQPPPCASTLQQQQHVCPGVGAHKAALSGAVPALDV